MLKIEHLTKKYGDVSAVDDLSLHINPGEIYGFIGHNGAGKTTTLKACCGLLQFDEGEIYVGSHSVKREPLECKKLIAYIPDNPDLYEFMSGIKYLNFIADIFGVGDERNQRIEKYATEFQIKDNLGDLISSYSHGMKQKISIIGALIHNPKLWVLDEPMMGLDPQSAYQLKELMKEHCRNGNTVFFSTHVLDVAEKLCDRVGIIVKGQLKLVGSMEEIKAKVKDESLEEIFLSVAGGESNETSTLVGE